MGRITLRQLIDRSDIDLVGVYVTSDKKNGLDAGQIARRPDTAEKTFYLPMVFLSLNSMARPMQVLCVRPR